MSQRPRGYADWSPKPETLALIENVNAVFQEYRDQLPLTLRQVFYRLVGAFGYEKTERAYSRLGEHLVRARRAQLIPMNYIRDLGGQQRGGTGFESIEEFMQDIREAAGGYSRDKTEGQQTRVELWCEAEGMIDQMARVANQYDIRSFSAGGFASVTVTYQIARRALAFDGPTVILHVGDYDPSGESIYDAIVQDASAFVWQERRHRGVPDAAIIPRRVALTLEQVEEYDLPTAPPKSSDSRSANWDGDTCQAEAMPPDILQSVVREAVEAEIDMDAYQEIVDAEEDERGRIEEWLEALD